MGFVFADLDGKDIDCLIACILRQYRRFGSQCITITVGFVFVDLDGKDFDCLIAYACLALAPPRSLDFEAEPTIRF